MILDISNVYHIFDELGHAGRWGSELNLQYES